MSRSPRRTRSRAARGLAGLAILLGAELNAETERQAAGQAGHEVAQVSAAELRSGS